MALPDFLFSRNGDVWLPAAEARGPFPGQHGGVVAGALVAAMETEARALDAGPGRQATTYLLRPAPVAPVKIVVRTLRTGGRLVVLAADMRDGDTVCAHATAAFVRQAPLGAAPEISAQPFAPGTEPFDPGAFSGETWFYDACEMTCDADGRVWARLRVPLVDGMGPLARVAALADWASGVSRPDWAQDVGRVGFPNADLTVHLNRDPVGDWIGMVGAPVWRDDGIGLTATVLYDMAGPIGRAAQTIVLVDAAARR